MESHKAELLQRVESDRDVLIDFLRRFIRCPSPNPPGDTRAAAAHIRDLLDRRRIDYRVIAPQETMPNIVATFAAGKPGRRCCYRRRLAAALKTSRVFADLASVKTASICGSP